MSAIIPPLRVRKEEPESEIMSVSITYEPKNILPWMTIDQAKDHLRNHAGILTQKISGRLTLELNIQFVVKDIEITDGSVIVKFAIYVRDKMLVPGIVAYLSVAAQPAPSEIQPILQEYEKTCNRIEIITEETVIKYNKENGMKTEEIKTKKKKIGEFCF